MLVYSDSTCSRGMNHSDVHETNPCCARLISKEHLVRCSNINSRSVFSCMVQRRMPATEAILKFDPSTRLFFDWVNPVSCKMKRWTIVFIIHDAWSTLWSADGFNGSSRRRGGFVCSCWYSGDRCRCSGGKLAAFFTKICTTIISKYAFGITVTKRHGSITVMSKVGVC